MSKNNCLSLFLCLFSLIIILPFYSCKRKTSEIIITPDALKNHLQRTHLFNNVSSIETESYYYSNKDSLYIFIDKNIQHYNTDGYLTQVFVFNVNNDTISKKTVYYLTNGKESYWEEYNYNEQSCAKNIFLYNKYGFKSEEQVLLNDSLLYRIEYKTDAIGSMIEMKRLLSDYMLTNTMYYNDHGLVARIEEYDPQNKLYKFIAIDYDNFGDEVNRRAFKNSNELIEYTYTQYNKDRSLQKIIFEDLLHNHREEKVYTHHDVKGNWLEEFLLQGTDTLRKRVRKIAYY